MLGYVIRTHNKYHLNKIIKILLPTLRKHIKSYKGLRTKLNLILNKRNGSSKLETNIFNFLYIILSMEQAMLLVEFTKEEAVESAS